MIKITRCVVSISPFVGILLIKILEKENTMKSIDEILIKSTDENINDIDYLKEDRRFYRFYNRALMILNLLIKFAFFLRILM